MNIIIEGPDGAGKTTLIKNHFSEGAPRIHFHNGLWNSPFKEYVHQASEALGYPGIGFVWDRCWMSNLIYAPLLRTNLINRRQTLLLEQMTKATGAITVICLPPEELVISNWMLSLPEQLVKDEETMRRIWGLYSNLARRFKLLEMLVLNPFEQADVDWLLAELPRRSNGHVSL